MNIPYNASLTREPFLFYEMRTTARLLSQGISSEDAVKKIAEENLFQYPTEKTIRQIARGCCRRLESMGDPALIQAIAAQSVDVAKQICLYSENYYHQNSACRLYNVFLLQYTKYYPCAFSFQKRLSCFDFPMSIENTNVLRYSHCVMIRHSVHYSLPTEVRPFSAR